MKTTDYNFKVFSAFAIVLIVVGHVSGGTIGFGGPFDLFPPYAYHVAAFVFVSGYFYDPSKENCIQNYIWTKIKRIIISLYLISFVCMNESHMDNWHTFISYGCKQFAFAYLLAGVGFSLAVYSIWCFFHKRLESWKVVL